MAVTSTPRTFKLSSQVLLAFPAYRFVQTDHFAWSATDKTIHHEPLDNQPALWTLLHEVAHAQLKHAHFDLDIELIDQEVAAWQHAQDVLAPQFGLVIDTDHVEDHLDTYRHWLHERSLCPRCLQNGFQTTQNTYRCSNCRCLWRVNDARGCALRRTKIPVTN